MRLLPSVLAQYISVINSRIISVLSGGRETHRHLILIYYNVYGETDGAVMMVVVDVEAVVR